MIISTKGRYALRVMIELSQNADDGYISLNVISKRQGISMKYLESIVGVLNKAGMVESQRGKTGGYRLVRTPGDYTVGEIVKLTEGSLSPVSCHAIDGDNCERSSVCLTLPMWRKLDNIIEDYLKSVTLQDLIDHNI